MNHIRDKLPDMKARLNTLMGQAQQELNSFGDSAVFGDKNQVCCLPSSPQFVLHLTPDSNSKAPLSSGS